MAIPKKRIEFSSFHRPGLTVGDYQITVTPSLRVKGNDKGTDIPSVVKQDFSVTSERFVLNPTDIKTVFPPAGSIGDHSNVLPHLVLKRSTLPWERKADPADNRDVSLPWLALLLFDDTPAEKPETKLLTVAQLQTPVPTEPTAANDPTKLQGTATFPGVLPNSSSVDESTGKLKLEKGQQLNEVVTVIDVKANVLAGLLPTRADLPFLAHVRQEMDDTNQLAGGEFAAVIGNRLPNRGGRSIVHLVSLENQYDANGFYLSLNKNAPDTDLVRLVSLKSWSFSCLEAYKLSQGSINNLSQTTTIPATTLSTLDKIGEVTGTQNFLTAVKGVLGNSVTKKFQKEILRSAVHETFRGLLMHLDRSPGSLRLPKPISMTGIGEGYLEQGAVALAHFFRNGNQSASWYHGPFVPEISAVNFLGAPTIKYAELKDPDAFLNKLAAPGNDALAVFLHSHLSPETQNGITKQASASSFSKSLVKAVIRDMNHLLKTVAIYDSSFFNTPLPSPLQNLLDQNPVGEKLFRFNRLLLEMAYANLLKQSKFSLPVITADELLIYDPTLGMFNVSYASAWELGRLVALKDKKFSTELYNWKRNQAQCLKCAEVKLFEHLPYGTPAPDNSTFIPKNIANFFDRLSTFELIPFDYLVPEEAMLPVESIRFFKVDPFWLECLLDGAFSIGRVSMNECERDKGLTDALKDKLGKVSGFLLRSDVVAGWPDLIVDGYATVISGDDFVDPTVSKLSILRMERLSPTILLCLFDGEVKTLDIHLKPEALHFGLDPLDNGRYEKKLRTKTGAELMNSANDPVSHSIENKTVGNKKIEYWRKDLARVLSLETLANEINMMLAGFNQETTPYSAAEFTLQMIEGVELVRFRIQDD